MIETAFFVLVIVTALGCSLMAGTFFIFSNTVMGALAHLKPAEAIRGMQAINRVIINPLFFLAFIGTAVACMVLAISRFWLWSQPNTAYLLLGSLSYLIGVILVTIVFNVPMNESLDTVESQSAEAVEAWRQYLSRWTAWNHVRTIASLLATALFMLALS